MGSIGPILEAAATFAKASLRDRATRRFRLSAFIAYAGKYRA